MRHTLPCLRILALILAFLLAPPVVAADAGRLGSDVVPSFQAIELKLDAAQDDYSGRVRITLEVKRETNIFRFHSEGSELSKVALSRAGRPVAARHEAETDELVRVTTEAPMTPGRYTLEVEFTNTYDTQAIGLYRMEHEGVGYLFTQFQVDDAREAFPCWDEPEFKIPYQMTLAVPEGDLAVTNTPIETAQKGIPCR